MKLPTYRAAVGDTDIENRILDTVWERVGGMI